MDYWKALEAMLRKSKIVIDRPKGTSHPRYPDVVYPLGYGYLDNTVGGDGHEIDIWVGSGAADNVTGVVVTVNLEKRDAEQKLLISCGDAEMKVIEAFHHDGFESSMLLKR
ncbi:MAG: hypothetical protein P8J55_00820 [Pseudomonadales bacterium]|nr:hypothetical protein [Pseudomonadales bacterium]